MDTRNPNTVAAAPANGRLNPANVAAAAVNRYGGCWNLSPKKPFVGSYNPVIDDALRRRKEDEIAHENLAMFKRLQRVKPSAEASRAKLHKAFEQNMVGDSDLTLCSKSKLEPLVHL